jgi:hypothetical protein
VRRSNLLNLILQPKEKELRSSMHSRWKDGSSKVKADINNTVNCFKTIRRRLKEVKIDKLKVFSSEIQDDTSLK